MENFSKSDILRKFAEDPFTLRLMIEIYSSNSDIKSNLVKTIRNKYSFYSMFQNGWIKNNMRVLNKSKSAEN